MMHVRLFTAAALAAVGLLSMPAAAQAADPVYPPQAVIGGVTRAVVTAGGSASFEGSGFRPGETIAVTMQRFAPTGSTLGAAANADAAASGNVEAAGNTEATAENAAHVTEAAATAVANWSVVADGLGAFRTAVRTREVGRYLLTAIGSLTGNLLRAEIEIRARGSASDGTLPVTGPDGARWAQLVAGGTGAVLLGAMLVWRSRRRRTTV